MKIEESEINNADTNSKDVKYVKSIIKEIIDKDSKRKTASSIREFNKTIAFMSNSELIDLSKYLTGFIESNTGNTSILDTLLDNILEHITGAN